MSRKAKAAEFLQEGYDIKITGRNVLVTDAMKAYALDKLSKVDRLGQRITDVTVIMDIQKVEHRVDINIWIDNAKIVSSASTDNMYASLDRAVDKLIKQITRYKARMQQHHSLSHADVAMRENVYTPLEDINEINEEIEEENNRRLVGGFDTHKIVKTESKSLKTLTTDEALFRFELSGDLFLIYRDIETMKPKIIYRRELDGNYGVVEIDV